MCSAARGSRVVPPEQGGEPEGPLKGLPPLLSDQQRAQIEAAFATPGLQCMLVCSEIPFVGSDPTTIRKAQKKVFFLVDHWPCAQRLNVAPASSRSLRPSPRPRPPPPLPEASKTAVRRQAGTERALATFDQQVRAARAAVAA